MKQTVVISGASDGLGLAIARELTTEYMVIALARSEEKLQKVAAEIGCDYVVCDVTRPESIQLAVDRIKEKHSRIDCLINNAGVFYEGNIEDNSIEQIKQIIEVNTLGTIYLTRAVIPLMKAQKKGQIINVISQAGMYAKAKRSLYHASKWAITGFTKCLEHDLSPFNIKVTGFYPGKMNTKLFKKVGLKKDMSDALQPDEAAKAIKCILSLPDGAFIPEIGIKKIEQF